jgi:hypothetical protein
VNPSDLRGRSWAGLAVRWICAVGAVMTGWLLLSRLFPETGGMLTSGATGPATPVEPPSAKAQAVGYEARDVNALALGKLAAGLLVGAAIVMGGMVLLNRWLHEVSVAEQPNLTAAQRVPLPPPAPNLQADPAADLVRLRAEGHASLESYAWIDAAHTRARIPIQRAMALMAGRPLDDTSGMGAR